MKRYIGLMVIVVLLTLPVMAGCSAQALSIRGVLNAVHALRACVTSCSAPALSTPGVPTAMASATVATAVPPATPSTGLVAALEGTLEQIYTQVNPSVVHIEVTQKQEITFPTFPEIPGFIFPTPQAPQEFYRHGTGSGFVWDKEGHIVTNNHVVADVDRITVVFYDGTTVEGKVVGTDPDSDLAVVKVDVSAERLQPVRMADSAQLKVGQLAVAIGNPFALQGTMTVGFVSALGRLLPVASGDVQGPRYTIPDVIQTDAPINPGNSGGVLVDEQGRVIGVTSALISSVGTSAGVGFAIPSAIVQKVVPGLIQTGHYEHPRLGVSGTSLTPDLSQAMGLEPDQRGALVVEVVPDSPADKAGLRGSDRQVEIEGQKVPVGGDVIVAIDGQPVKEFDDVVAYLARHTEVGQTVTLTLLRQGEEVTVKVTLAARPESQEEAQQGQTESGVAVGAWLGIVGLTVTPEIAQAMNLASDQQGILVEQVQRGSPADDAGLRGSYKPVVINGQRLLVGGDVVVAADDRPVTQASDLHILLGQAQTGQKLTLTLLRDGKQVEVAVTLGERPR